MSETKIKPGPELVTGFIKGLSDNPSLDSGVIQSLQELHAQKKLTKARLLQELEKKRRELKANG